MFQAAERRLWDRFKDKISEEVLRKIFEPGEVDAFMRKKRRAERDNVDLGWVGVFSFPYILRLARFYGLTDMSDEDIKLLKEVRNKVAHSDHHLIKDAKDVRTLAEARGLFLSLIGVPASPSGRG